MESYREEILVNPNSRYTLHLARSEDAQEIFDFYCLHFFHADPLGTLGAFDVLDSETVKSMRRNMVENTVKDNVSVIIRDTSGKMIGAAVNKLEQKSEQHYSDHDVNQRLVWKLVYELNKDTDFFAMGNTDRYVYIYMLAVDESLRRKGLASKLIEATIELAKENNAGLIKAEFLSTFAYRAGIKHGFKTVRCVNYSTFEYNGTKPLATCSDFLAVHPNGFLTALAIVP